MDDAEIIREVTSSVEVAIRQNRRIETVLIVMLSAVSASGLGLLAFGLARGDWKLALPGGLCELAVTYPVKALVTLRQENIRLQVLPQMMRLAKTDAERKLVFKFIENIMLRISR